MATAAAVVMGSRSAPCENLADPADLSRVELRGLEPLTLCTGRPTLRVSRMLA
jgi:hypothetical protein